MVDVTAEAVEEPTTLFDLHTTVRRLATVRSRIAENEATARQHREQIDHWLAAETKSDRERAAFLEAQAGTYLLTHLDELHGRVSLTTPFGRVVSRFEGDGITWPEDGELIEWARQNGYLRTRTVEAVDKASIRRSCRVHDGRLVAPTGETVPGVVVAAKGRSVRVET